MTSARCFVRSSRSSSRHRLSLRGRQSASDVAAAKRWYTVFGRRRAHGGTAVARVRAPTAAFRRATRSGVAIALTWRTISMTLATRSSSRVSRSVPARRRPFVQARAFRAFGQLRTAMLGHADAALRAAATMSRGNESRFSIANARARCTLSSIVTSTLRYRSRRHHR